MFALLDQRSLTAPRENVTINPIEGDSESDVEIPPHLNEGLWPEYLLMCELRFEPAPTDGRESAPGAPPSPPTV